MSFLYPYLLWGLLAVSIPVIIHLFNFRKFRKVYFTNVRFLEELQHQTRRQSQLRHMLVMLLRMLAIAALVFAFAQPYLPAGNEAGKPGAMNRVCIHIDDSFSMEASTEQGNLLETARSRAREIVSAFSTADLFMITSNAFEGRQQRWISQEEALRQIDDINISPYALKLSEVTDRLNDRLSRESGETERVYIVSDFQESMADIDQVATDSSISYYLVPVSASRRENLHVDSCWFATPVHQLGQSVRLVARVVNSSGQDFEKVPLKLIVNGSQKALAAFDIRSESFVDVELPFTSNEPGIHYATLEITDYPITFDDRFYLVYHVAGSIPVLSINGGEESIYLNSLFGSDSSFRFDNNPVAGIDFGRLQEYELIILHGLNEISSGLSQELGVFLENGGTLLVIPSGNPDLDSYRKFFDQNGTGYYGGLVREETRVSELDLENPLFEDVFERTGASGRANMANTDLPKILSYYEIGSGMRSGRTALMTMLNGKPFLVRETAGKGEIYLLSVPLADEYSNFARHAIFVPVMFRIALLSAATDPLFYVIGRDRQVELRNASFAGDRVLKIAGVDNQFEFIPSHQNLNKRLNLGIMGQVTVAGHYRVLDGDREIRGLGFNYDRMESVMTFADADLLREQTGRYAPGRFEVMTSKDRPLTDSIKDMNQGTTLWKLFIILALAMLAAEIVLLRYWKTRL